MTTAVQFPDKFVRVGIQDTCMFFNEAKRPFIAFLSRDKEPAMFDAWVDHIHEHWTALSDSQYIRPESEKETTACPQTCESR